MDLGETPYDSMNKDSIGLGFVSVSGFYDHGDLINIKTFIGRANN
jgi:hypothetical protein